jgi:hypothetical protein
VLSGVFITEEIDGRRDNGQEITITGGVQTLLEAILNMSLRSACAIDETFFWQKLKLSVFNYCTQMLDYQGFPAVL